MSVERVRDYLAAFGVADRVQEFDVSSATVALAAEAVGVEGARIVKTLSFQQGEGCFLVAIAGDAKVDNAKFKARFGIKAKMLSPEAVVALTGHAVGGVCPFAVKAGVPVYIDVSVRRFETVFPAAGSGNSAIGLTPEELYACADARDWVDVCKGWQEENP